MRNKLIYICYTFFIVFFVTCKIQVENHSQSSIINSNNKNDVLEVNPIAYHINDSITNIFLEINKENLLYKRTDTGLVFYAEVKINFKLFYESNNNKQIEQGSYFIIDRADEGLASDKAVYYNFKVKTRLHKNYNLQLEVLDVNKKNKYQFYLPIDRISPYSKQNILLIKNHQILYKPNLLPFDTINIIFFKPSINRVYVDCFNKEFEQALPPFSIKEADVLKYKPDSTFQISLDNSEVQLIMPSCGFLHVKYNQDNNEGLSLYSYNKTFPKILNTEEMINCTSYIMNKEEFEKCTNSHKKKIAIDNFWLSIGGTNEKALELIKLYYGRVYEANKYYTSYTQGWKTDRGMIHIVFGQPSAIYKNKKDEIWVYGSGSNPEALRFVFKKTDNPYSNNDYVLERSFFYKLVWQNAIDFWKQGLIYYDLRSR
jgi:GWxTD domain-containing protein